MKAITQYIDPYPIEVKCSFCSKKLVRNKYYLKRYPISFCSQPCKILYNDPTQALIMSKINTNQFAYLIGLIVTDGHIRYPGVSKTHKCMIKLNKKDKDILQRIQKVFGGSLTYEGIETCCWYVSNKDFVQYLHNEVSITNQKTYNLDVEKWFNSLDERLKWHFIRGCFDGDGGVYLNITKSFRCHASICSASQLFIEMLQKFIGGNIVVKKKEKHYNNSHKPTCDLFYLYLNGRNILKLSNAYEINSDDLFFARKSDIFKQIQEHYKNI
jgi:hypothetical protein